MARARTSWRPGQSGNPAGRKPGTGKVDKLRALLQPHAEELVAKAVEMAKAGDTTALRLCLERLIPPMKARDEPVQVEGLQGRLVDQGSAALRAMGEGQLTPEQTTALLQALATQARLVEVDELSRRLDALEGALSEQRSAVPRLPA